MSSKQATAHIDLDAIHDNFEYARQLAPGAPDTKVMAVIKADAYGHGASEVARKLASADAFGVARVSEGVKLREAGIDTPICLLEGVSDREELNLASIYEFQVVIHSSYQLDLLEKYGARRNIWLKVDTGMGRLGFRVEEIEEVLGKVGSQRLIGFMTHLASADEEGSDQTAGQIGTFEEVVTSHLPDESLALSVANSAGILTGNTGAANWIRPGLMLYGASPMADLEPRSKLHPAMTFSAPVIAVRQVKAGESVGYGGIWAADRDCRIAVIAAGYADGYPRETRQGTPVMINGQRRPLVGRVSMDMITVQLEQGDQVHPGDRAILWGEGLPIEEIADCAGTITYTLMCSVSARVPRVYRGKAQAVRRTT